MGLNLVLITHRDIFQGMVKYQEGEEYQRRSALVRVNPQDLKELGVAAGSNLRLTSPYGSVVAQARADQQCPQGYAYLPISPYASRLTGYDPEQRALPTFKGTPVQAEPSPEAVTPLEELESFVLERK